MPFIDSLHTDNDSSIIEENQNFNSNAHLEKLISEIFKTDNISIRSDLSSKQVLVFAKAQLYAQHFEVDIINNFLTNYMTLALSKNRTSRKELVEISKNMGIQDIEPSLTDKLLGK